MISKVVGLNTEQMEVSKKAGNLILDRVMKYDLTVIRERFLNDHPELSERVDDIELLYRKYMYLCSINTQKNSLLGVPSDEVDEFWHCHIIHTRSYQNFCQHISGHFIHHNPHSNSVTYEQKRTAKQNFLDLFTRHFQESYSLLGIPKCGPNCTVDCSDNCSTCTGNCAGGGNCDSN
ncbi:hypothetical protein NG796_21415 [Laspinema sp. A4]|nr:hypothetical protein [Laspinema sp. D2d]